MCDDRSGQNQNSELWGVLNNMKCYLLDRSSDADFKGSVKGLSSSTAGRVFALQGASRLLP